jgi:hypothetical protein
MSESPFGCSRCGQYWTSAAIAHCAACHRNFPDSNDFDRHRHRGRCRTADTLLITAPTNAAAEGTSGWHAVNSHCPHSEQASREHLEDIGLTDDGNCTGSGDPAHHVEEMTPT